MDIDSIELNIDSCLSGAPNTSVTGDYSCGKPNESKNENHRRQPVLVKNVARKKTSLPPYSSYLSEINVNPIDQEIPTIRQFSTNKAEKRLIPASDTDDDVCIWVEQPVVIDLTSDDEPICTSNFRHDLKNEVFEVYDGDVDENDLKSGPIRIPVDIKTARGKPYFMLPKLDNILITPSIPSVNATPTGGKLPDITCMVTAEPSILRIRSVESLNQALLIPGSLGPARASPVNTTTSSGYISPHHQVTLFNQCIYNADNNVITTDLAISQAESQDVHGCHKTDKHPVTSEPCQNIDDEHRSKKRKLLPDRLYDASASREKQIDFVRLTGQTFATATSTDTKADLVDSKTEKERDRKRRHRNDAYEKIRQSRMQSSRSPVHSKHVIPTSSHQRTTGNYGKLIKEHQRPDSVPGQIPTSSRMQTENWSDEYSNGSNQMNNYSRLSENQRSSRLPVDDHSNDSSRRRSRSRIRSRSPIQRRTVENGNSSERYRSKYSGVDKSVSTRNERMNDSDTNSATRMNNKRSRPSDNQRSSPKSKCCQWETIMLTKESCRSFLSSGYDFLDAAYDKYHVLVRVTWAKHGNVLCIRGTNAERSRFKEDLAMFTELQIVYDGVDSPSGEIFDHNLPRRKNKLIKKIEDNLYLLEHTPADVDDLFASILANESLQTKNGTKHANRARKDLNMILLGRAGLRDGPKHLAEIKRFLKTLKNIHEDVINKTLIAMIEPHFNYIFSAHQHYEYPALIAEYKISQASIQSTLQADSAQSVLDSPIENAHQSITNGTIEPLNHSDEPAQVPTIIPIEGAQQILPRISLESTNDNKDTGNVMIQSSIKSQQNVAGDSIESLNDNKEQATTIAEKI